MKIMKIKYITEDSLLMLRNHSRLIYEDIVKSKNYTILELLKDENLIKETPYEINDFKLVTSQEKGKESLTDGENVQIIYNNMMHLSDSQASDERIWVAYTLHEQLSYMKYRWKSVNERTMLNRYFFNYHIQRSLFRNGISRLWWIGRMTYDKTAEDPYELTKFICKNQDFIESIFGRNIFNNSTIQRATLRAIYDADKRGTKIDRLLIRGISKYLNLLGGAYLIDMFDYNEIYERVTIWISEN